MSLTIIIHSLFQQICIEYLLHKRHHVKKICGICRDKWNKTFLLLNLLIQAGVLLASQKADLAFPEQAKRINT